MNAPVVLLANNATTTLAAPITAGATTASLAAGTGSLFPNPSANQNFPATLIDAATGNTREIVTVTGRSGDTITMVRGQEGTAAHSFTTGDYFKLLVTAGTLAAMSQIAAEQSAAAQLFASTGFQELNSGLIVQWGTFNTVTGHNDAISFPKPFPNACLGAVVTEANATGWAGPPPSPTVYGTTNRTTTGMEISGVTFSVMGVPSYAGGLTSNWIAWGF